MTRDPLLVVSPASRADLSKLARIQLAAFSSSPFQNVLFPAGATPDTVERMTERFERAFDGDEFTRFVVVRSTAAATAISSSSSSPREETQHHQNGARGHVGESGASADGGANAKDEEEEEEKVAIDGEIVGFARWHCFERERALDELREREKREWPPEVNLGAIEEFFGQLDAKRKNIMGGKPHYMLGVLAVDPAHQRRGGGAMLMEWWLQRADTLGLPVYLEATPKGIGLYKKYGFEQIDQIVTDLHKWGGEGIYVHPCMIRQPLQREGGLSET